MPSSSKPATIDEVRELVSLQLGVRRVEANDELMRDLGAESADLVNLVATLEDRYGLTIAEEEISGFKTVQDLFVRAARG